MQKHVNTFLDKVVGREITCKTTYVFGRTFYQLHSNKGFVVAEFSNVGRKTLSPSIALHRNKQIDRWVSGFFGITIDESHKHVVNWLEGIYGVRKPEDFRKFIPHA
jgi:hypothetical protein